MASWADVEREVPELAATARGRFEAHTHHTIATLRRDGSPRISGVEAFFAEGELWFGMMHGSRKALDLRRDPRFALHSGSEDPPAWEGDAKLAGHAIEADEALRTRIGRTLEQRPEGSWHLFRTDIAEVATVRLNDARDALVIELWRPGQPLKRSERR